MQIRYHCPTEGCVAIIEYEPFEDSNATMKCPRCSTEHPMHISQTIRVDQQVDCCAICRGKEFFIRKDFPQRLGFAIVVIFGLTALYYFSVNLLIALAVLASAIVLDLVIYTFLGKVTTCYACRAEYRKCNLNATHEGFDLATSEKY